MLGLVVDAPAGISPPVGLLILGMGFRALVPGCEKPGNCLFGNSGLSNPGEIRFFTALMNRPCTIILAAVIALLSFQKARAAEVGREYILVTGGVSLMGWEKYKGPQAHDHWWANFVRASRIRMEQLRGQYGPDAKITWMVYKPGYLKRQEQEKINLLSFIDSVRDKWNVKLVYFEKGPEVINYLNFGQPRDQVKIADFEYFGHSNKACFLFDYSNEVDSASKAWLHENDLSNLHRGLFTKDAFVKSWGCHTGESMSRKWASATGSRMWGAQGRTMYQMEDLPIISTPGGKWTR